MNIDCCFVSLAQLEVAHTVHETTIPVKPGPHSKLLPVNNIVQTVHHVVNWQFHFILLGDIGKNLV